MTAPPGTDLPLLDAPPSPADMPSAGPVLVCPWLKGLKRPDGLWLAILPIHDANAWLDEDWTLDLPAEAADRLYFGVFALDRLRSAENILGSLRARGVRRIANLPTIACVDGATRASFAAMGFTPERELDVLLTAQAAGFGVAFCTDAPDQASPSARTALDFIVALDGPGRALRRVTADHGQHGLSQPG